MIQSPSIQPYRDAVDISSLRWPGSRPCACPVVQANSGKFRSKPLKLTYRKQMKSVRQWTHETKARDGAWTVRKARKDVSGGLPGGINRSPGISHVERYPAFQKQLKVSGPRHGESENWRVWGPNFEVFERGPGLLLSKRRIYPKRQNTPTRARRWGSAGDFANGSRRGICLNHRVDASFESR